MPQMRIPRILAAATMATTLLAVSCSQPAATAPSAPAATAAATTARPAATTAATTAPSAPGATQAAPVPAGTKRQIPVLATDTDYKPDTIEVKPGESVVFVFTNAGAEKHNLVGPGSSKLLTPDFQPGDRTEYQWAAPTTTGSFKAVCTYHAELTMTVNVK